MTCFFAGIKSSATKIGLDLDPWCTSFFPSCLNDAMWISAWQPKQTFPFHLVHWCFPLQQACPTPQSQCFNVFGLSSNSNNSCWHDRVASIVSTLDWKWFSVTAVFGSEGTGGMVIDWDVSSCSSNWVICSLRIAFYWSFGRILVTCILILHSLSEHLYPGTQLVNLPQLTDSLITIKWITLQARNLYWDKRLYCYNLVLLSLSKHHCPKYFSIW